MKKVLESVQNFKTKRQEAIDKYKNDLAIVERNFIKGSDYYKQRMNSLKEERDAAIKAERAAGLEIVNMEINDIRSRIEKVDYVSTSPDIEKVLARIGKMTDTEKEMVLKNFKGTYMDTKLFCEAMGQPFTSVDDVITDLNYMEGRLNEYYTKYSPDTYNCLEIEHGKLLNDVDEVINDFISQYGGEE